MAFTARTETYVDLASLTDPFDITVTKPSGTVDGDILFCWIGWVLGDYIIDSEPSGWVKLADYTANSDRYALYYKIASSEPASWVWSFGGSVFVRAVCSCYTSGDFNGSDPIDVVSNTPYRTYNTNCIAASMNVAAANSPLVFWGGCYATSSKTYTKPSVPTTDWVEDDDAGSTTSRLWTEVCSMIWSGSGATGDMIATISALSNVKHAFAVALKPAAGGEFVYAGNVALNALPSYASALDRVYGGAVGFLVGPGYQSALDRTYAGSVPVSCLPSSLVGMEKGYQGDVGMMFSPSYVAAMEKGYQGGVDMALSPSYLSVFDRAYQGQVDLGLLPTHALVMDRLYGGDVPLGILPAYESALEKGYEGTVVLGLLPSHSLVFDRIYGGDAGLSLLPSALYSLEGANEFLYSGNVALIVLPSYASLLDRVYAGTVSLAVMPSYQSALEKGYEGQVVLGFVPGYQSMLERRYEGSIGIIILPEGLYSLEGVGLEFTYVGNVVLTFLPSATIEAHGLLRWAYEWEHWR